MQENDDAATDMLTPSEMRGWLKSEIADAAKAFDLRLREASDLVVSYALGELTPTQARQRLAAYDERWGEALAGASAVADAADHAIITAIDRVRSESKVRASIRLQKGIPKAGGSGEHSI